MDGLVGGALLLYAAALLALAWRRRSRGVLDYLLAGRRLTTPAFVATLVATWYGGVLGVGEFSYRYGIANWLVFGAPYYVAALLFGFLLAARARRTAALSIPDQLGAVYGTAAARIGASLVLLMALPAAYVLMLGELAGVYLGAALPWAVAGCTAFVIITVAAGGFRNVVDTNALQFVLMFGAFALLLPVALHKAGGLAAVWHALPPANRAWDGGMGPQFVLVWYVIALQTLVEPTFYQRCYAARSPAVARNGVLVSIAFWIVFDALTTLSGLAARVLLPHLADPVLSYPELGRLVLPPAANALFAVGLFATVMSTAHSYLFLAASTIGHDVVPGLAARADQRRWTMAGLLASGAAAVALALALRSVVAIWHDVGSIVTSALLLPLGLAHAAPRWRYRSGWAVAAMVSATVVATVWILARDGQGAYPCGVEPVFPALGAAALAWVADRIGAPRR